MLRGRCLSLLVRADKSFADDDSIQDETRSRQLQAWFSSIIVMTKKSFRVDDIIQDLMLNSELL
jgi:hypothetical protein